ncbi:MAG: HWE histidine kinase domain-containing protein [Microvirga sp.]
MGGSTISSALDLPLTIAALDAIGEAIVITSPDLDPPGPTILFVNAAFTRMTGYAAAEAMGRSPRFLQGMATDRTILDRMRVELAEKRSFIGETINYRKDGTMYVVEWLVTPMENGDGRVTQWIAAQRDVTDRHRAAERQDILINELNHRVKNTLATVQSIAFQTLRSAGTTEEAREGIEARLFALARAHDVLTQESWNGANLRDIITNALGPYTDKAGGRVHTAGPHVRISPRMALAMAMALQELATNAVKYGSLSNLAGTLDVTWQVERAPDAPVLRVLWREAGGPVVAPPTRRGFGTRLVEQSLAQDLNGSVVIAFEPTGVVVTITASLED